MSFTWAVYGVDPQTGAVWRVLDTDGDPQDTVPRLGMMIAYQPGTPERMKMNGDWYMYLRNQGHWVEATDAYSALVKHQEFPAITCTRHAYYATSDEWDRCRAVFHADRDEIEGR